MIRFSQEKVLLLHQLIIQETGGSPELRDINLLNSAIEGVYQTFGGQELYPTKEEKGARLGYTLISNHAFVDGNKRIGMYVMLTFLEVSAGTFQLKKDIVVVDLRSIAEISPFVEGLDYLDHAINKLHLERLNQEMSKSLRRSDSTLDYVPTQYIVDYIKSIQYGEEPEYAGIVYNSTTNPGGFNLAIFEPTLFDCIDVEVHNIPLQRNTNMANNKLINEKKKYKECNMKNRKEARTWDDAFDREFFTTEEISESDMRASIITAMIEEREAVGNGSC